MGDTLQRDLEVDLCVNVESRSWLSEEVKKKKKAG
mgnify:CR=1 FL=1